MRVFVTLFFLFTSLCTIAVDVPSKVYFAGMELHLTEAVQRTLKADLDMIMKSPKAFQTKVDRANLHFPIIERALKAEGLPDEFKFLSLQESSLIPDAVSSSNAVGYWQFKKETAKEVGLRVDHIVDERMNLVASSHGAARYMKKNNTTLQNWVYALLAYNTGLGGVKSYVDSKYVGASKMTIDKDMHWYVIRFLAHKLAYENAVGKETNPVLLLIPYEQGGNKSLRDISHETEIDVLNLELYNKWLLHNRIPEDKLYSVVLPVTPLHKQKLEEKRILTPSSNQPFIVDNSKPTQKEEKKERKPRTSEYKGTLDIALLTNINKIKAIKAKEGDTPLKLAVQGGISLDDFLRYNELKSYETVVPGKIYFLQPKRKKAAVMFHTVKDGETIKEISQLYGVKIKAIRTKNRMEKNETLEEGRVLWLRMKRPDDKPVEYKELEAGNPAPIVKSNEDTAPVVKSNPVPEIKVIPEPKGAISVIDNSTQFHEVNVGETLYSISRIYSVSVDSLKSWNNLSDNGIHPGMKLNVKKKVVSESIVEHIVVQGETLYQISRKYNVKVEDILLWNNKKDSSVSIGEKLIIKKSN